jgi:cobalt-zinc-cadmium efflux system outer membrane protein
VNVNKYMRHARGAWRLAIFACIGLVAFSTGVRAQASDTIKLTAEQARAAATKSNPRIAVARSDVAVSRADLKQAKAFSFNPSAEVLTPGFGLGPEISVVQELEIGGQRSLRRKAAIARVGADSLTARNAARTTLESVDRAFNDLAAAGERLRVATEIVQLNTRLVDVATRQLKEGEIARLDVNLATVDLSKSKALERQLQSERDQAEVALKQLTGLQSSSVIVPVTESVTESRSELEAFTDIEDAVRHALARRPDLASSEFSIIESMNKAKLARRSRVPNVVARAAGERSDGGGMVIRPGIGITLPIFYRNSGAIAASDAQVVKAQLTRKAVASEVSAEVQMALINLKSSRERVDVLASEVLPQARENRRLLEIAYQEGKVGLPILLLIRNQVLDSELEYWDAWLNERNAAAAVRAALSIYPID